MIRNLARIFFLMLCLSPGVLAQSVTAPAVRDTVKAAPDYATETLRDRWDMNERTDLGFRIFNGVSPWSVEQPPSYLTNIGFNGGLFTARSGATPGGSSTYSDVNISVLDSSYPGVDPHGNKFGSLFPINADKYRVLAFRMDLAPNVEGWPQAELFWSKNTVYQTAATPDGGVTSSNLFAVFNNWAYYLIDVPALGVLNIPGLRSDPWQGMIDSLRFDPIVLRDKEIRIDWIRLVEKGAAYQRTIAWTGFAGSVDLYLDNDRSAGNGHLGLLARGVSGTSYPFLAGALAAGNYYVAVAPAGTTNFVHSAGYYEVTDQPIIEFTKPSAEGSDQDYVSAVWNDPWDMANAQDVERAENVNGAAFTTISYEDLAGNVFSGRTVYAGLAAPPAPGNVGDPIVRLIHFWPPTLRGATRPIDTSKYHNLVLKMGLAGASSPNDGSIARVVWKLAAERVENVARAFLVRHAGDRWIRQTFVRDLKTIELEPGGGSPSHSGWTGLVDAFRVDPHEFSDLRGFFIDEVRLTADWTADASFALQWNLQDGDGPPSVSLYYDIDNSGFDGTAIVQNLPAGTSYTWNTSGLPNGTYYLYAVASDGLNQNRAYAGGPVIVNHASGGSPTIALSRTKLVFGAAAGGATTGAQSVVVSNSGTGTLVWTATAGAAWISVAPGSGTGAGTLTVGVSASGLSEGNFSGTVFVSDPNATNNPRSIAVNLTVYGEGGTSAPIGFVDTPTDGTVGIEGSVPVTGWVVDDIEAANVKIYRDPDIYIGDAVFVEGARPDVELAYPSYPMNYKAGWGYMMLTNFLPNQGNGTFRIHAIATDKEGKSTLLGSKTITCDNAHATLPFGAIDVPNQGGTASGSAFINYAWVLTPMPKMIPTDGSTITAWVDGLPVGRPSYGYYRVDIATLFPGYANANGAIGYIPIDTTKYPNGVHTIVWSATDSAGVNNGFGSRYFSIQNAGSPAAASANDRKSPPTPFLKRGERGDFQGRPEASAEDQVLLGRGDGAPVFVRRGFDLEAPPEAVFPDPDGVVRIEIPIAGRVEISLDSGSIAMGRKDEVSSSRLTGGNPPLPPIEKGGSAETLGSISVFRKGDDAAGTMGNIPPFEKGGSGGISMDGKGERLESGSKRPNDRSFAFQVVGDERRPLPIGSTFEAERGILVWQPGVGFFGSYVFVVFDSAKGLKRAIEIRVSPR